MVGTVDTSLTRRELEAAGMTSFTTKSNLVIFSLTARQLISFSTSYNFSIFGRNLEAGPDVDIPPETVTPLGKRAIEARPDVNVSNDVGIEE